MNVEKIKRSGLNPTSPGFTTYFKKMKGESTTKSELNYMDLVISAIGCLIAMSLISIIAVSLNYPMALGPVGASCLLIFGAHKSPFSQPRQVIGGHFIAATAAITISELFGRSSFTIGLTLGIVIILMVVFNTIHPPAAASAIVVINTGVDWGFIPCMLLCIVLLVGMSLFYNNLFDARQYPKHWI